MALTVDGTTRLHLIVGDPIAQVKSPTGMTAAFAAAGHNAVLVPVHVSAADLPTLLAGLDLAQNVDGIIATVPHKFACFAFCRAVSDRARILGAVNVITRRTGGGWYGDMLDGLAFVTATRGAGCEPKGQRALLVGAGGAGSAIGLALVEAGVATLAIHDVDPSRRDALIGKLTGVGAARIAAGSADPSGFDLIANATPAGMRPTDPLPVDTARLDPAMYVGCVITAPAVSPLIASARAAGCRTSTGSEMYAAAQRLMLDFLLG